MKDRERVINVTDTIYKRHKVGKDVISAKVDTTGNLHIRSRTRGSDNPNGNEVVKFDVVNEYVLSRVAHESFIPEGTYMGAESVKLKIPIELGGVNPPETPQYEQMPTFATNGYTVPQN